MEPVPGNPAQRPAAPAIHLDAALVEAAAVEAARSGRSVEVQLEHWIRLGMALERSASERVRAVVRGEAQAVELDPSERVLTRALIDAGIATRAADVRFADTLRGEGQTVVVLDADGRVVEHGPLGA